jgi:hypothetical protein
MHSTGPRQTAEMAASLPTAKKGGSASASRLSQLLAITSAPIPAGSPSATASGRANAPAPAILDHRVAAQVAQQPLGAAIHPLLGELHVELLEARRAGILRIVAAAQDEDADAFLEGAERLGRLADIEVQHRLLERRRQVAHADVVAGDHLGADAGGGLFGAAAAAHRLAEPGKLVDPLGRGVAVGAGREVDRDLLQAEHRVAGVGHQDLAGIGERDDREAARNLDRIADRADRDLADDLGELVRQLLGADPAEIAPDRRGRGLGELPRISDERGAAANLLYDAGRVGARFRRRFGRGGQEDFGDAILARAARGLQPVDDLLDLLLADADEGLDLAALESLPGEFGMDLALDRLFRRADAAQIFAEALRRMAEAAGEALVIGFDLGRLDLDVALLGGLDLQRLVHQVAQHLGADDLHLLGRDLGVAGERHQSDAMVDVGAGNDRAVDDRGRGADRRVAVAEELGIVGNGEPGGRGAPSGLRASADRGQRNGERERRPTESAELHHSSNKSRPLPLPRSC